MNFMKYLIVSLFLSVSLFASNQCEFTNWTSYKTTSLRKHSTESAYIYTSTYVGIDADGAPNAYHRNNDLALDYLANAGHTGNWWGIVTTNGRSSGTPYVQESGRFEGFYVSATALEDTSKDRLDTARYVDSTTIPYIVFPGNFYSMSGTGGMGDIGYAINLDTGDESPFIVADIGPSTAKLGEMSIALASNLGGDNPNPKNGSGAPRGRILYIMFPYSHNTPRWNGSLSDLTAKANSLLNSVGGMSSVLECESLNTDCQNECSSDGELSCNGSVIEVCRKSSNGCFQKIRKETCGAGFTCSDGGCIAVDDGNGNINNGGCSISTEQNSSSKYFFLLFLVLIVLRKRKLNN